MGFGSEDSREQHNLPPCGLWAASGTNSSSKARGLCRRGRPYGARGSCESLGRAWKELERVGRKGAGWLSNFSPGHFPPLPSVPTKALLRNVGPQKAPFETPKSSGGRTQTPRESNESSCIRTAEPTQRLQDQNLFLGSLQMLRLYTEQPSG